MKHALTCPHCSARLSLDLELRTAREAGRTLTVRTLESARARVAGGASTAAVARELGVAPSSLSRALRGRTWAGAVEPIAAARRMSAADRDEILRARAEGLSLRAIARATGWSTASVSKTVSAGRVTERAA